MEWTVRKPIRRMRDRILDGETWYFNWWFNGTWLALVKPRPSQCTWSTLSLTSHVQGSKHGSSTSSSELSTRGVCVEVGVGVGVCDALKRCTHPRATARVTHCILLLLPFSSTAWGCSPASGLHRTAKWGKDSYIQTQTHTTNAVGHTNQLGEAKQRGGSQKSPFRVNHIGCTSEAYSSRQKINVKSHTLLKREERNSLFLNNDV